MKTILIGPILLEESNNEIHYIHIFSLCMMMFFQNYLLIAKIGALLRLDHTRKFPYLIFCITNKEETNELHNIFEKYHNSSRQHINYDKSVMVFGNKVTYEIKDKINKYMPITFANNIGNYLGLPTQLGKSKRRDLNYTVERIREKLYGWKKKNLSYAGKITLIKTIIQVIPTHATSVLKFPK